MNGLKREIHSIINESKGHFGIYIEEINKTNKNILINSDFPFPAKSIIKVPIMAALFESYEAEQIDLSDKLIVKKEDLVGGSGVLKCLNTDMSLSIYNLIILMIIQSDNTATNILIDYIGFEKIRNIIRRNEMNDSSFNKKMMIYPARSKVENYVSAKDCASLLKKLYRGELVSYDSSKKMIEIMKMQQQSNGIAKGFPIYKENIVGEIPSLEFANKTGWDDVYHHDMGIIYTPQTGIIISILSKLDNKIETFNIMTNLGDALYRYISSSFKHNL